MNQLHYKKPAFWIILIALSVCVVVSGCSQANSTKDESTDLPEQTTTATPVTTATTETPSEAYQSASIAPEELVGKWVIDPEYIKQLTGQDMQSLYGTAFGTYGSGMEFDNEGNFNYYIAVGTGGEGTYTVANQYQNIPVKITEYMDEKQAEFVIQVVSIDGNIRLLENEGENLIVWEKV